MGRFATTVPYYRRFRPPYPPAFFRRVARALGLDGSQALVDLGCGPGLLALGFAPYVRRVVGVDPEAAMLAAAREAAAGAGVRLRLVGSRVEDLPGRFGPFDVVTIGRALHWLDRGPTLARLDRLVRPGGVIVICGASPAAGRASPWQARYDAFRRRVAPEKVNRRRHAHDGTDFFAGSPFAAAGSITVQVRHRISIDVLVGRLFSMSNTSPAVLGPRIARVESRLRAIMAPLAGRDGSIAETVVARANLFARPAAAGAPPRRQRRI